MQDLMPQARPEGEVEKTVVCPELRLQTAAPFGFHLRWFREDPSAGPSFATGLLLAPRSRARIDLRLKGEFHLSVVTGHSGRFLRIRRQAGDGEPVAAAVSATLLDGAGAGTLQHALAGSHPIDIIRRLLPLPGCEEWRWLQQSCGVAAVHLENLQEALRALPVAVEGLLWETARDHRAFDELVRWIGMAGAWKSSEEAAGEIGDALERDAEFAGSAPFALLDFLGLLAPGAPPVTTDLSRALRAIAFHPTHGTMMLRLYSVARRFRAKLCGSIDATPWREQAERITENAPLALARELEQAMGVPPRQDGWLLDAIPASQADLETAFLEPGAGGSAGFAAEAGWRFQGPLDWVLRRRRTINVRLPWLPAREAGILARRCQSAQVEIDGPGQVRVPLPTEDYHGRWSEWAAEVLSGPFSRKDGLPRGGPDRLSWSVKIPLEPGRETRFLARLLKDYRFPPLPEVSGPAELTFDISVRRELVENWAEAPHSKDPEYARLITRIARTLQWSMRRWIPLVYFLENPDNYSSRTVMPILIYAASTPRALFKRREFGYEVVDKTQVAKAIRSASRGLANIYRHFDPDRRGLEDRYRGSFSSNAATRAMNHVWRFPRCFEQLLHFDLFLIEQSIHFIEGAQRLKGNLHQSPSVISKMFQSEVDGLTRAVRNRLRRNLPANMDDYVPLVFIQAISALAGEGMGADIPAASLTIRQDGWTRVIHNAPSSNQDEQSFDGLSIPSAAF